MEVGRAVCCRQQHAFQAEGGTSPFACGLGGPGSSQVFTPGRETLWLQEAAVPFSNAWLGRVGPQFFLMDRQEGKPPLLARIARDDPAEVRGVRGRRAGCGAQRCEGVALNNRAQIARQEWHTALGC